jgi:hypothetical protein
VPKPDGERLVFEGLFTAGLHLSCHDFLIEVLRKSKVQLHQLTPNVVVALSTFVWATTTFGGGPSNEAFAEHYCLHWQKRSLGRVVDQFGSCTFTAKPGKTKEKVIELAPYAKNKWGWMKIWFYVCCSRGKGWPLASTLSVFQFEAFPHNAVEEGDHDDRTSILLLLYVAVEIRLSSTWSVGFGRLIEARLWAQLPIGISMVSIGRFWALPSQLSFGSVLGTRLLQRQKGRRKSSSILLLNWKLKGQLNFVMGMCERIVCLARWGLLMKSTWYVQRRGGRHWWGPAQSHTLIVITSTCSVRTEAACFEVFDADLTETCGHVDVEAGSMGDFAELVTRGKLGRDFISSDASRFQERKTMGCKGDDYGVRLRGRCAGSLGEGVSYIPLHNIPYVIVAPMDLKGKAPALS